MRPTPSAGLCSSMEKSKSLTSTKSATINTSFRPLLACENPKSIYIIGGGDGGAIEEAAKHPGIERIVMAEIDQVVIDKSKEYLPEISRGAFDDKRLDLRCVDALKDLHEEKTITT